MVDVSKAIGFESGQMSLRLRIKFEGRSELSFEAKVDMNRVWNYKTVLRCIFSDLDLRDLYF